MDRALVSRCADRLARPAPDLCQQGRRGLPYPQSMARTLTKALSDGELRWCPLIAVV